MRRHRIVFPSILFAVSITVVGCARDSAGENNTANTVAQPVPVKVLVRRRTNSTLAIDGIIFQMNLMTATLKHERLNEIELTGDDAIKVEEDSTSEMRSPADNNKIMASASPWTRDSAAYDYVVTWTLNSVEQKKTSLDGDLVIDVNEEWKIQKPTDASVTKSWKCGYMLRTGKMKKSNDEDVALGAELIKSVIAPARGPILREIRSMIEQGRSASK